MEAVKLATKEANIAKFNEALFQHFGFQGATNFLVTWNTLTAKQRQGEAGDKLLLRIISSDKFSRDWFCDGLNIGKGRVHRLKNLDPEREIMEKKGHTNGLEVSSVDIDHLLQWANSLIW